MKKLEKLIRRTDLTCDNHETAAEYTHWINARLNRASNLKFSVPEKWQY